MLDTEIMVGECYFDKRIVLRSVLKLHICVYMHFTYNKKSVLTISIFLNTPYVPTHSKSHETFATYVPVHRVQSLSSDNGHRL